MKSHRNIPETNEPDNPHNFSIPFIPYTDYYKGFYSDKYFLRTRDILNRENRNERVTQQFFTKKKALLCGIKNALEVIRNSSGKPETLKVKALDDGDNIVPWETVMLIEGPYRHFAHLETVLLGLLARGTKVATRIHECVNAAEGRSVFFFAARFDHPLVQPFDGYAAVIGGAEGVSTDANGVQVNMTGMGTIPHSLIAAYRGDTVQASKAFNRYVEPSVKRIALVDFDNDSVTTSLRVADELGDQLWGVRLDTAEDMGDSSVKSGTPGVCAELVENVRKALDSHGHNKVKILVSGGFNPDRIRKFVEDGVPFDAVGVGSWIYRESYDFTADVVLFQGKHCAKKGRTFHDNERLKPVTLS
jgi:nicotinate phosphoribosyltransferase